MRFNSLCVFVCFSSWSFFCRLSSLKHKIFRFHLILKGSITVHIYISQAACFTVSDLVHDCFLPLSAYKVEHVCGWLCIFCKSAALSCSFSTFSATPARDAADGQSAVRHHQCCLGDGRGAAWPDWWKCEGECDLLDYDIMARLEIVLIMTFFMRLDLVTHLY